MFRLTLVLGVLVAGTLTARAADPKPADDLAALQGNWKPLQCDFEGMPQMPAEHMKQVTGVYDKNEYFLYFVDKTKDGQPNVLLLAHTVITLDPTATPKTITIEFTDGALKGVKRLGIYEIAGNQLKLCYSTSEKLRPTQFKSTPGSGCFSSRLGRGRRNKSLWKVRSGITGSYQHADSSRFVLGVTDPPNGPPPYKKANVYFKK